jgi:hypothetical protein
MRTVGTDIDDLLEALLIVRRAQGDECHGGDCQREDCRLLSGVTAYLIERLWEVGVRPPDATN